MHAHNFSSSDVTIFETTDAEHGNAYEIFVPDKENLRDLRVSLIGHCLGALVTELLSMDQVKGIVNELTRTRWLVGCDIVLSQDSRNTLNTLLAFDMRKRGELLATRLDALMRSASEGHITSVSLSAELEAMQKFALFEFYASDCGSDFIRWVNSRGYDCVVESDEQGKIRVVPYFQEIEEQYSITRPATTHQAYRFLSTDSFFDDTRDSVAFGVLDNGVFYPTDESEENPEE